MTRQHVWHDGSLIAMARREPPFGPGFDESQVSQATRLECWESEWGDPDDKTEWRLYRGGELLARQQIDGF